MPVARKLVVFLDEIAEFLLAVLHHWKGALTSSVIISVGLTVYQLATGETLKLQPYLWTLVGVGLPVAIFLAWAEEYRGRNKAQRAIGRPPDFSAVLDTQLRLSNTNADHESQLLRLHSEDDAIRADVDQDKLAIKALTADNTALKSVLTVIIASDVKIAKANLALNGTLRNQVLLLVAELREIGNRIKITGDYPAEPTAPPGWHVSSSKLMAHVRAVQDFIGRQTWKQYWDIYHAAFDRRVRATISDLQLANVASEKLIAFPEHVGPNELDHDLPFSVEGQLIPELLSAADALTGSQSS
jgi:hypothetical protein